MKRDAIDLSTLNVFTLFRKYFVPTLLGMLSMSAVTAIDGIFVGHGVGSDGIAAVNICVPLLMLFTGIGLMVGAGCSVVASIQLSRGKSKSARLNVTQALLFVTIVALIPSVLMMAFPAETARMLGSSEHLLPMVTDYLLWFVPSWVFQIWITVSLFVIRLDGSPKLAMLCSLITAVINVVLDWLFIFPFGWGVMGAAFATSISIMVGGLVAMVYLLFYARHLRLQPLKWSVKSLRLSVRNIGYQWRIGSSALLGEATLAVLMFVGNQVFMSYLGDDGVGAFGIACYYIPFVFMVGNAIAQSAQPIISYNFGLGYKERVMTAERIALLTAVVCGVVATVAFTVYPYLLVGLFISLDSEAAKIAIHGFPYFASGFVFFIVNIARAHGGKDDPIGRLSEEGILGISVRTKLLASILRLSDELADDSTRASKGLLKLEDQKIDSPHRHINEYSEIYHRYSQALHSVEMIGNEIKLSFCIQEEQLERLFRKKDSKGNITEHYLLDEIFERTEKMFLESLYCNRFFPINCRINAIKVKINLLEEYSVSFKTYSYEIEESGYPSIANGSLIDLKDDSGNKINGEYIAALIKKRRNEESI